MIGITNTTLNIWRENDQDKANPAINTDKNHLLIHAMPLLITIAKIKNITAVNNIESLRQSIIDSLKAFEINLRQANYSPKLILATRYCLTTALDEAVMKTDWGAMSCWIEQSLLSIIHKETWGGERFFVILEKLMTDPKQHLDLLEVIFVLIKLGFQGKYSTEHKTIVEEIQYRLFHIIRCYRELPTKQLSSPTIDISIAIKKSQRLLLWRKRITLFFVATLLLTVFVFNYKLHHFSHSILQQLNLIAKSST